MHKYNFHIFRLLLLLLCVTIFVGYSIGKNTKTLVTKKLYLPRQQYLSMFLSIDSVCSKHQYGNQNVWPYPMIDIDSVVCDSTYITVCTNLNYLYPIYPNMGRVGNHVYVVRRNTDPYFVQSKYNYSYYYKIMPYMSLHLLFWKLKYYDGNIVVLQHYYDQYYKEYSVEICHCIESKDTINIKSIYRE